MGSNRMPLLAILQASVSASTALTTALSVGGSIVAGAVINYLVTTGTMRIALAKLEATSGAKFEAMDETTYRHENEISKNRDKIAEVDNELSTVKANCEAKHQRAKAHQVH